MILVMNSRRLKALTLAAVVAAFGVVALNSTSQAAEAKPWRSIRPEAPAQRLHLKNIDPAVAPAKESRTWTRIAVGDTLVFRYRGNGEFRFDARPVMSIRDEDIAIRYGVRFGNQKARNFLRRSDRAGRYGIEYVNGATAPPARLGKADRKTLALDPTEQTVLVYLRENGAKEAFVRGLVRGDVERLNMAYQDGASAKGGQWSIDAALGGAGYVDNAYMAPKAGTVAEEGAGFWPADVQLRYRNRKDLPFRFTADYDFSGRFFSDPILDERRHSASLEERWDFGQRGGLRDVRFKLSQEFKTKDDTFFGRGAADEFQTSGTLGVLSFADRFDYMEYGGEAEFSFRTSDHFQVQTQIKAHRRDYDKDFTNDTTIYSLDQNRFEFAAEFAWEVATDWTVALDAGLKLRNYDEKFARNISGSTVSAEPTRLRRWPVEMQASYEPKLGLQASASVGLLATQDQFEGYWDRTSTIYGAELGWKFSRRNSINAWFRGSSTSYDNATVGYVPTGTIRDKSSVRFGIDGEYGLFTNADLVLGYSYQDLDNNSPTFAYKRSEIVGGVVLKY